MTNRTQDHDYTVDELRRTILKAPALAGLLGKISVSPVFDVAQAQESNEIFESDFEDITEGDQPQQWSVDDRYSEFEFFEVQSPGADGTDKSLRTKAGTPFNKGGTENQWGSQIYSTEIDERVSEIEWYWKKKNKIDSARGYGDDTTHGPSIRFWNGNEDTFCKLALGTRSDRNHPLAVRIHTPSGPDIYPERLSEDTFHRFHVAFDFEQEESVVTFEDEELGTYSFLSSADELHRMAFKIGGWGVNADSAIDEVSVRKSESDSDSTDKIWQFETGDYVDSSPTVVDGTVYVGSDDENLYAVDANSGTEQWRFETDGRVQSSPTVVDGTVYVGSNDENLYAVDADSGTEQWRFETDGHVISSPTVVDGTVYVGSVDENLYAVDADSGTEQWRFETGEYISTQAVVASSPTVVEGTVYVGSYDDNLYAVDAGSGDEQWRFETGDSVFSSPTVVDGTVYVGSWDDNLYAVDADSGTEQWRFKTEPRNQVDSSPTVVDGTVYVGNWDDNLYAVDAGSGTEQWRFETDARVVSSPTVVEGTVYVGSFDENLYAVDADTGGSSEGSRVNLGTLGHHHAWADQDPPEEEDPTVIEDWTDLNAIRDELDGEYVLVSDLDADTDGYGSDGWEGGTGWDPIGSQDTPFTGILNGDGHEIADLVITRLEEDNIGLFGVMDGAEIRSISVSSEDVAGGQSVGTLVGFGMNTTIQNSSATGSVYGNDGAGGLIGSSFACDVIESDSTQEVSGGSTIGGLVGHMDLGSISKSYSTATVDGNGTVGGLVGQNQDGTITESYATGTVDSLDSRVGGLVGINGGSGLITRSYATGDVSGSSDVGGLVGSLADASRVIDSYATGSVDGDEAVGGLVGFIIESECEIRTSYATGAVSGEEGVGGLVGVGEFLDPETVVSQSYWDVPSTGQTESSGGGTGFGTLSEQPPAEEMTGSDAEENMDGFDFDDTWVPVVEPDEHPDLRAIDYEDQPAVDGRSTKLDTAKLIDTNSSLAAVEGYADIERAGDYEWTQSTIENLETAVSEGQIDIEVAEAAITRLQAMENAALSTIYDVGPKSASDTPSSEALDFATETAKTVLSGVIDAIVIAVGIKLKLAAIGGSITTSLLAGIAQGLLEAASSALGSVVGGYHREQAFTRCQEEADSIVERIQNDDLTTIDAVLDAVETAVDTYVSSLADSIRAIIELRFADTMWEKATAISPRVQLLGTGEALYTSLKSVDEAMQPAEISAGLEGSTATAISNIQMGENQVNSALHSATNNLEDLNEYSDRFDLFDTWMDFLAADKSKIGDYVDELVALLPAFIDFLKDTFISVLIGAGTAVANFRFLEWIQEMHGQMGVAAIEGREVNYPNV